MNNGNAVACNGGILGATPCCLLLMCISKPNRSSMEAFIINSNNNQCIN